MVVTDKKAGATGNRAKMAIVVSHPIQHFCPQYVSFASNPAVEIKVFFASMLGFKKFVDPQFKQEISWSNLSLESFQHEFLNGDEVLPATKDLDAPGLNDALDTFSPNIVITYGYFQKLQRRAKAWANHNKVPVAYISDSERRQHRHWLKELLKYPVLKRYFSGIQYFLSVGNANEAFYRYYGVPQEKILRMHFPIDTAAYSVSWLQRKELNQSIRKEFGIAENEIVLTVVGKLVSWKNQDHIIAAMQLLEERNIFTHLFILGSGEMMETVQQKAAVLKHSKVHCCGFVSIDRLPAFYAATDIYVHPASVEPHSIAISEAIYMGCPVVLSDRCGSYGAEDDVQEGKNGWVYPFGDIDKLAGAIERLASNPSEREQFGDHSHQIAVAFQQQSHVNIVHLLLSHLHN